MMLLPLLAGVIGHFANETRKFRRPNGCLWRKSPCSGRLTNLVISSSLTLAELTRVAFVAGQFSQRVSNHSYTLNCTALKYF